MKFMVTYKIKSENYKAAMARFKKTGALPPKGVKLLGRWSEVGLNGGFALFETNDPGALSGFLMNWADVAENVTVPVVEDEQIKKNLA